MQLLFILAVFWIGVVVFIIPIIVWGQYRKTVSLQQLMEDLERRFYKCEAQLEQLQAKDGTEGKTEPQPTPFKAPSEVWRSDLETESQSTFTTEDSLEPIPELLPRETEPPPAPPILTPWVESKKESAPAPASHESASINWERFLGVKMFAWVGGLALFLGVAFFLKYSFENNLVSPQTRISCGYLLALGLIVGGLLLPRERHVVTVQTLSATGILILYANTFAAHAFYKFIGPTPAFLLMSLITVTGFLLAWRLDAQVIAILGLLGGFLTPPLLSSGVDNPSGLFGYLAILNAGLIAISLIKRWHYLILMAALLTILMEVGWVLQFFEAAKVYTAMAVFLGFGSLFLVAPVLRRKEEPMDRFVFVPALLLSSAAFGFAWFLMAGSYYDITGRAPLILGYVTLVDLLVIAVVWMRVEFRTLVFGAGGCVFLFFAVWLQKHLTIESLIGSMVFVLLFAVLHTVLPMLLQKRNPIPIRLHWLHLAPLAGLVLILLFILKLPSISWVIWPLILAINILVLWLAITTVVVWSILASFALTLIIAGIWILGIPREVSLAPMMLIVIGGFAVFFVAAGFIAARQVLKRRWDAESNGKGADEVLTATMVEQIVSIASALPFLLLTLVVIQLPLSNPNSVFGLAVVLLILFLGICLFHGADLLVVTGLASILILEHTWHFMRFQPTQVVLASSWYLGFGLLFLLFPFCFRNRMQDRLWPWVASALALPLHFLTVYKGLSVGFPSFPYKGLIPAMLAVPCVWAMVHVLRNATNDPARQQTRLALFGGASLFFITFIFPTQFDRQWITIGWALEGVALLWLFQRIPHPGLRIAGVALLAVSFIRLGVNPWTITAYARTGQPLLNWYLYAYLLVAGSLFLGARLLAPPSNRLCRVSVPPLLCALGTILLFFLVNIQIADFFSPAGQRLTFHFSGRFDQDMTYSLAWGVFAFVMLIIGFRWKSLPARFAGLGLLVVTLLKLFLHDLWRLGGLYRIGSLVGLAVLLMVSSFIYQRFLSNDSTKEPAP